MSYLNKDEMSSNEHINKIRLYLDYLEEHIDNVRKAFCVISEKCKDMYFINDETYFSILKSEVTKHDLSKFSVHEFVQYREAFYPIVGDCNNSMEDAWEHHKINNTHHHETVKTDIDLVHMVIDWTAMGYKFGDTAQEYYEANADTIKLSDNHKKLLYDIFYRLKNT